MQESQSNLEEKDIPSSKIIAILAILQITPSGRSLMYTRKRGRPIMEP